MPALAQVGAEAGRSGKTARKEGAELQVPATYPCRPSAEAVISGFPAARQVSESVRLAAKLSAQSRTRSAAATNAGALSGSSQASNGVTCTQGLLARIASLAAQTLGRPISAMR